MSGRRLLFLTPLGATHLRVVPRPRITVEPRWGGAERDTDEAADQNFFWPRPSRYGIIQGSRPRDKGQIMRHFPIRPKRQPSTQAAARIITLITACLLLAGAATAYWFYRADKSRVAAVSNRADAQQQALSAPTVSSLQGLTAPLEIRLYCSLDAPSVSEPVQAFARRVEQLVAAYQRQAGGKISVTRFDSATNFDAFAAAADGIKPFNVDKGAACFLGIALKQNGKKECLPQLLPEWEQALEPDLTRAILRLQEANRPRQAVVAQSTASADEVKRALPNLDSISLEDGTRQLHDSAVKDLKANVAQFEAELKDAQERVVEAQNGKSESDQKAALQHLQELRAKQVEKLREIAARSKAQVEALQQLKQTNH